jgi:hypothetical protein
MGDSDTKFRKPKERRSKEATAVSESPGTRILEEVIEELQAELDRAKNKKKPAASA